MTRPTTPEALRRVLEALRIQQKRASGEFHLSAEAMNAIVDEALAAYAARLPLADDEGMRREAADKAMDEHRAHRFTGDARPTTVARAVLALIDKKLP